MKIKELRKKTAVELEKLLKESQEKLREGRFKVHQNQLKNIREIRDVKHEIARLLTLIKEKGQNKNQ